MKNIEAKARREWDVISNKITNLRNTAHLETTRKYLIKDVEACIQTYRKNYDMDYDPINPPGRDSE